MDKKSRIYVAGHTGLVGSALMRELRRQGYTELITRSHAELDLRHEAKVAQFFLETQPEYVFLAAAKVGGIWANNQYPADFIQQNLQIQTNVITQAKEHQVKRLLFLGSSCIYPRDCPQPIKEAYLLTGPLELTNRPYALAKIAGIELCAAFNRQYGTQFLAAMPTNLYGPLDNYDLHTSHVIPALIRKMHEAKMTNQSKVILWGTGEPKREFLYSDDLADACVFIMGLEETCFEKLLKEDPYTPVINVGCGSDLTISELSKLIAEVVDFRGQIHFDSAQPDGTPRKTLAVNKLSQLGWQAKTPLSMGIKLAYHHYLLNESM